MQRYRYDDVDPGEMEPLDYHNSPYRSQARSPNYQYHDDHRYQQQQPYYQQQNQQQQYYNEAPQGYYHEEPVTPSRRAAPPSAGAGAPPSDPPFDRLRAERQYGRDRSAPGGSQRQAATYADASPPPAYGSPRGYNSTSPVSGAPQPPPHRAVDGRYYNQNSNMAANNASSAITPGADNFSESAAGGMAGIAYSVAERNARESGIEAMNNIGRSTSQTHPNNSIPQQPTQVYNQQPLHGGYHDPAAQRDGVRGQDSYSNLSSSHGRGAGNGSPSRSQQSFGTGDPFIDDPYQGYSRNGNPNLGVVNPHDIVDDGDDGLEYRKPARNSMLSLSSERGSNHGKLGAGGGLAAGGVLGALGARSGNGAGGGGNYGPVNASTEYNNNMSEMNLASSGREKSEWLEKQGSNKKKWTWCIVIGVVLVLAAGIACGVYFGVIKKNNDAGGNGGGGGGGGQSAGDDTANNGDLNINSAEIKKLLNNKNLHKIFPGIDYTPLNTQYPECIHNPPSQNNVTRDMAILSQMTNTIRLYGTDCNQTQMVLHSIKQLKMENTVKVWLGVWQDSNTTTNERQLSQMWDILDEYGEKPFKGLIVANEILFRQEMTVTTLGTLLAQVRTNLTAKGMSLPVATSDLGDNWTAALAQQSDYIMANIHPFFAGEKAENAAMWTYAFWENHNSAFFKADKEKNVISEIGWPSQGGMNCGTAAVTNCPDQSVAGINQMNQLMEDWVCAALSNGTNYFWFEAFDEPWKIKFNTKGKEWEDHWGLLDIDRNLKPGVKIPDCGGKTVD